MWTVAAFPHSNYLADSDDASEAGGVIEGYERVEKVNVVIENVASLVRSGNMATIVREIGNLDVGGDLPEYGQWLVCKKDLSAVLFYLRSKKEVVGRKLLEVLRR